MRLPRLSRVSPGKPRVLFIAVACVVLVTGILALHHARSLTLHRSRIPSSGPPWVYGRLDARFTLIEYADLECPYCGEYFPMLRHWIDAHPEVNWQWHHLPLSIHDPAATQAARLAECAGETSGNTAFWNAVAEIYEHTRRSGEGLLPGAIFNNLSPDIRDCLKSDRPDALIRSQVSEAVREHISATPTLRLFDHHTGKSLTLQGSVEGDTLLSAVDLLASSNSVEPTPE